MNSAPRLRNALNAPPLTAAGREEVRANTYASTVAYAGSKDRLRRTPISGRHLDAKLWGSRVMLALLLGTVSLLHAAVGQAGRTSFLALMAFDAEHCGIVLLDHFNRCRRSSSRQANARI
jgi:hypothetical protein